MVTNTVLFVIYGLKFIFKKIKKKKKTDLEKKVIRSTQNQRKTNF